MEVLIQIRTSRCRRRDIIRKTTLYTALQQDTPSLQQITPELNTTKPKLVSNPPHKTHLRPFLILRPPLPIVPFKFPRRLRSRINHGRSLLVENRISLFTLQLNMLRTAAAPGIAHGFVVSLAFAVEEHVSNVSDAVAEGAGLAQLTSVTEQV